MSLAIAKGCSNSAPTSSNLFASLGSSLFFEINQKFKLFSSLVKSIVPIDMLRLKLSFFGALKFDPRSDKWLRICMFQGAPLPEQLKNYDEHWVYN